MNICGIAYVALAGALLATAITLNSQPYPREEAPKTRPSTEASGGDAELARCRDIDLRAVEDGDCKAVWEASRRRFFQSEKLHRDRLTNDVASMPDSKGDAQPLEGELPRPLHDGQQHGIFPRPQYDNAGPLK
jgi:conjugative transfer region protein TrbK